jgi:hypothetical protein
MALFGSCMTIAPDNRSEVLGELKRRKKISISENSLVKTSMPVYSISSSSRNYALMAAGQMGVEFNYKYFIMADSSSNTSVSSSYHPGYYNYGTGFYTPGYSSTNSSTTHTITVAYTNDESVELKYDAYECSSLLDGRTFLTKEGRAGVWTLFGISMGLGFIICFGSIPTAVKTDKYGGVIGGGVLICLSYIPMGIGLAKDSP